MAFTVGWPSGNSGVSVAYADDYFTDRANTVWTSAQTGDKQGALVRATDYVRALFAPRFDLTIFAALDPELPAAFTDAICEYAVIEIKTPGSLAPPPQVDASGYGVVKTKRKVGPIESGFTVVGGSNGPMTRRPFPIADALIATLLLATESFSRVTR